jgi:hypothetical protein
MNSIIRGMLCYIIQIMEIHSAVIFLAINLMYLVGRVVIFCVRLGISGLSMLKVTLGFVFFLCYCFPLYQDELCASSSEKTWQSFHT